MKALSIRQPWAHIILAGIPLTETIKNDDGSVRVELSGRAVRKDVENRSWRTNFRGRCYIHASRRFDPLAWRFLLDKGFSPMVVLALHGDKIPRGAILGEIDIVDCVEEYESPWFVGPWAFVLANPQVYSVPTPCRGRPGFFEPKEEVLP